MYLFYVDESGDPNGWSEHDNFVLGGVAVHEGQVGRLSEGLDGIQECFFPLIGVPIEFHADDIFRGRKRFRTMPVDERKALLEAAYGVIEKSGFPGLVVLCRRST